MPTNTLLELTGIDLGDYSVRGLTLSIRPVSSGPLQRDINGLLHDLTLEQFRKYELTISCTDHEAPDLDDVWHGKEVTVTCLPKTLMGLSDGSTDGNPLTMNCMVTDWENSPEEWNASVAWTLKLLQK